MFLLATDYARSGLHFFPRFPGGTAMKRWTQSAALALVLASASALTQAATPTASTAPVARTGNCRAALRLGEIHDKGLIGVPRDYAWSLKWYNFARVLGCDVPI